MSTILKNKIKYFVNAFYYFGGSAVQMLVAIFTSPIFARNMEPFDYAAVGYFNALNSFVTPIFLLSFPQYYVMMYYRQNQEENKILLFNLIIAQTVIVGSIFLIIYLALYVYFRLYVVSFPFFPYALLSLSLLYLNNIKTMVLINFRVRKAARQYFLLSLGWFVIGIIWRYHLVVNKHLGAIGQLGGSLIGAVFISIICVIILKHWMVFNFSPALIKNALKKSSSLILASYAYVPITSADRIFLERIGNTSEFGYYNIGHSLAHYFNLAAVSLFQAFEPDFYKYAIKSQKRNLIRIILIFLAAILILACIYLLVSKHIAHYLTAGRFTRAYKYSNIMVLGLLGMQVFGVLNSLIIAKQKVKWTIFVNAVGGVSAILVYYVLIAKYEYWGAAFGMIIVAIILSAACLYLVLARINNRGKSKNAIQ